MAIKMITPVRFEDRLSGLQSLSPPILADEVEGSLDIPIFDANPSSMGRPASGKLARCNNQGGLLTHGEKGFENAFSLTTSLSVIDTTKSVDFHVNIKRLILKADVTIGSGVISMTDSTYSYPWIDLDDNVWYEFPWSTSVFHIRSYAGITTAIVYYTGIY